MQRTAGPRPGCYRRSASDADPFLDIHGHCPRSTPATDHQADDPAHPEGPPVPEILAPLTDAAIIAPLLRHNPNFFAGEPPVHLLRAVTSGCDLTADLHQDPALMAQWQASNQPSE